MKPSSLRVFGCALLVATWPLVPLRAHGGQYRGPGNVVPPSTNSNAFRGPGDVSNAGGAAGPAGPTGSGGGGAANVLQPAAAGAGARAPRGAPVGDDLGRWEFWWEFGKDPWLSLREAIYDTRRVDPGAALWNPRLANRMRDVERPTPADLRAVAGDLVATLSSTHDRDTASACLVALAKIGPARAGFDLAPHFEPFLARGDQELRETAALCHGIAGALDDATIDALRDLVEDNAGGRKRSGGVPVNERTRAFAAYGIGLLLRRSRDAGHSLRLIRPLQAIVEAPERHGRNLLVAAIEALAQLPADWSGRAPAALRDGIVTALGRYYDRDLGAGDELVQAHVPTAIARLLQRDDPAAAAWRQRFAVDLANGATAGASKSAKVNPHIAQSCALALGELGLSWDDQPSPGADIGELLLRVYREHGDEQTRSFALLAIARIGGAAARTALLRALDKANKGIEMPWVAVALGVHVARARAAADDPRAHRDDEVVAALSEQFRAVRNPSTMGALAIAIGMTGAGDARDLLRTRLLDNQQREDIAGYVALGLGLLDDRRAIPDLRTVRRGATQRPFLLLQSVRALGMLGDHALTAELSDELREPNQSLVRLSATSAALGQIGDRRSLPALRGLLQNDEVTPLSRAFAAVALGGVCDKDPLPWNAAYATHVNYRAATETLTDGAAGILDIL